MTPDDFTALAMGLGPSVQTKTIFETVQFRVGAKAFATLGWPAQGWAVVKVAPARQAWALRLGEGVAAEPGRRRKAGIVLMRLAMIDEGVASELLAAAWSFAHGAAMRRVSAAASSAVEGSAPA